jgi:hypothetical protein
MYTTITISIQRSNLTNQGNFEKSKYFFLALVAAAKYIRGRKV